MKTMSALVLFALLTSLQISAGETYVYDNRSKVNVNGEAVVYVRPDKIVINLGIETWDKDINIAKDKNRDILKNAVTVAKECGIQQKEIRTDFLSIEPRWRTCDRIPENFIAYFVRNTFIVNLNNPEKVEEFITKMLQAGVNYIHGIEFQSTELRKYRDQARDLALGAAREKAARMASALGQSIGAPIQINEYCSGNSWRYYSSWCWGWSYGYNQSSFQNVVQNVNNGQDNNSETIALGKISIRASVNVVFELK